MIDDKYTVKHELNGDHVHVYIFNNQTCKKEYVFGVSETHLGEDVHLPNAVEKLFGITFEAKVRKAIRKAQKIAKLLNNLDVDYLERCEQVNAIYKQIRI